MIFISTDILNPYKRDIISQDSYKTLIDFLQDKYPNGFKRPTDVSINGVEIAIDDYDTELKNNDVVVLIDRAALPVGLIGGWFVTALANLAISVTLSYVANKLFAPDAPDSPGQPSSVYNLNSAQNMARYGSPIPIIYGKVRMFPSMIVQPYYRFDNDIEYLYHVLCIGQGTNTTDDVLIGDDSITTEGDFDWKLLYQDSFHNIPANAYGYHITKTLSVPSSMRIEGKADNTPGDESEKYKISAAASKVEFDYMLPNGLYWIKDGEHTSESTSFKFRVYTLSGTTYTEIYSKDFYDNTMTINAIQRTFTYDISSYNEPVYVSFQRTIDWNTTASSTSDTYIKRVKEIHPNENFTNLYGDITLLACKIKATDTISSAGQVKVNGYFERTDVGNTMAEVLTDLYTNTNYGGGLSASDLSFPTTAETVNCAYDSNITIFDAMRKPAIAQGYSLYLAGMDVILKKDGANNITSGMYNEMNILRGTFKTQYLFKEEFPSYDGFQCTYIDGDGWVQRSEKYPSTSTRPQVVDLFGVVSWSDPLGTGLISSIVAVKNLYYQTSSGTTHDLVVQAGAAIGEPVHIQYETSDLDDTIMYYLEYTVTCTSGLIYFHQVQGGDGQGNAKNIDVGVTLTAGQSHTFKGFIYTYASFPNDVSIHKNGYRISYENIVESVAGEADISYSIKKVLDVSSLMPPLMAKYLHKQEESRRKIVSFSTDIQGLVPQFLDKIMVSHNSIQWGEAGEVYSRSGDNLIISDALEDLTAGKTIVFRNIDGSVSDAYDVTIIDATNITVVGMPSWVGINTFYTIQEAGTAREFLVIAIKPNGQDVQIDCVNYDEDIYT